MNPYKVTAQFLKGGESIVATFHQVNDAKMFIKAKIEADVLLNSTVLYRLYRGPEVLEEFSTETGAGQSGAGSSAASSGAQKSAGFSFRPTPFNTTPRPPGIPPRWLVDDEEEGKSK